MRGVLDFWHSISSTDGIVVPLHIFHIPFLKWVMSNSQRSATAGEMQIYVCREEPFRGAEATFATGTRDRDSEVASPTFTKKLDGPLYLCLIFIKFLICPADQHFHTV